MKRLNFYIETMIFHIDCYSSLQFKTECLKNDQCVGYVFKEPKENEKFDKNCNILNDYSDLSADNDPLAEGWTLYKCTCCLMGNCNTFPDLVKS